MSIRVGKLCRPAARRVTDGRDDGCALFRQPRNHIVDAAFRKIEHHDGRVAGPGFHLKEDEFDIDELAAWIEGTPQVHSKKEQHASPEGANATKKKTGGRRSLFASK